MPAPPSSMRIENVWNDRSLLRQRTVNPNRPWYYFACRLLQSYNHQRGRALDVGCGVGEFLDVLKTMGFDVTGLDGNEKQVESIRARGFKAEPVDLEMDLPNEDSSFDVAICLEVLEHVSRAEHLLREIHRALAPGGTLILSTPNFGFWRYRLHYLAGGQPIGEGTHLRFFTPRSLNRIVENAGFEIVGRSSYGSVTGINYLRRKAGRPPMFWLVPGCVEALCVIDLVIMARKR